MTIRPLFRIVPLALFLLVALASSRAEAQTTFTVTTTADTNDGTCDADCSLREALAAAAANAVPEADMVTFASGVQGQTIALSSSFGQLVVNSDVVIDAEAGGGAGVTLDAGQQGFRVMEVGFEVEAHLLGLTITGGTLSASEGGGILNNGGTLTVTRSTVRGNAAGFGGGILNRIGTLTVTESTISGNSADELGGGIYNPALFFGDGTVTVTRSTISGNTAGRGGGGISDSGSIVTVTQSTFSGNFGGGISSAGGTVTVGNTAFERGATGENLSNTGTTTSLGYNVCDDACGLTGTGDLVSTDPLLGPLADNSGPTLTHALLPGSPAIDVGGTCGPTDQRGETAPTDGDGDSSTLCDAGSVEAPSPPPATCEPGDYTLSSQAEVDAFAALGCTEVTGTLRIEGASDLSGLGALTSVGNQLQFFSNSALLSLDGLDALTSVGNSLDIVGNDALTSLEGLRALTSVTSSLVIEGNAALTSLSGLEGLTSLGSPLVIQDNDALTSLEGLRALASVGDFLDIVGNASLTSLAGLDALTSVGGTLSIVENAALTSLDGLDALTSVGGALVIENNAALTDGACALASLVTGDPPAWSGVMSGQVFVGNNGGVPFDSPANLLAAVAACFNQPPVITAVDVPADPVAVGADVTVNARFTDSDVGDTHTCSVDYGDGSDIGTNEADGLTCTGTHAYAEAGIYTVSVTVTDAAGESDTEAATDYVVVYDPSAGFVTGGGWIDSPEGAYVPEPTLTGRASFGFVARYKKGRSTPDGNTQFQFNAAGFSFRSTAYDWLVVAGKSAKFKGVGTVDGAGDFGFMLTATDGGSDGDDLFRIKIWDRTDGDAVVYDNGLGADDDGYDGTALGGGQVVLHDGRGSRGPSASASLGAAPPAAFALEPPYPNPSARAVTVGFDVPEAAPVRLAVYDALGREVAVLVDRAVEAGRHTAVLDGAALPTGTYLVRLTAGALSATQRLTLLR